LHALRSAAGATILGAARAAARNATDDPGKGMARAVDDSLMYCVAFALRLAAAYLAGVVSLP